jgi:phytoene dehydrogenase-like protein
VPASEYIQITLDSREAGLHFAMPRGGVRALIRALTRGLRQAGGELFVRSPVSRILVQPAGSGPSARPTATGVRLADGRPVAGRVVIHNGGPRSLVQLMGPQHLPQDYLDRLAGLAGVECAALFCATREPLFTGAPIAMTPGCRRIAGVFSPTLLDPGLARNGLHLSDAFFPLRSADRAVELELALADMRDLFPNFEASLDWYLPMFFTGAWPGAESGQAIGQTGDNRLDPVTPVNNCFLVGMDVKGSGVAGDLIPLGVRRLLEALPLAGRR